MILAATFGSIVGDNAGYWIGHRYAYAAVLRYGRHLGLSEPRIKVGQYLFRKHGGKVVSSAALSPCCGFWRPSSPE